MLTNSDTFSEYNESNHGEQHNLQVDINIDIGLSGEENIKVNDKLVPIKNCDRAKYCFLLFKQYVNYFCIGIFCVILFLTINSLMLVTIYLIGVIGHFPYLFHNADYGNCMPLSRIFYDLFCYYSFEKIRFLFFVIGIANIVELLLYCVTAYGIFGFSYMSTKLCIYVCCNTYTKIKKHITKNNALGKITTNKNDSIDVA